LHGWYGSPLKLFDLAKSAGRVLYVQAPMVRYVLPGMWQWRGSENPAERIIGIANFLSGV